MFRFGAVFILLASQVPFQEQSLFLKVKKRILGVGTSADGLDQVNVCLGEATINLGEVLESLGGTCRRRKPSVAFVLYL